MLSLAIATASSSSRERLDGQHRAERLVLYDGHRAVAVVEHRRQVVEARRPGRVVGPRPPHRNVAPSASPRATYASTFVAVRLGDQRPRLRLVVERAAEADQLGAADQLVDELVVDRLLDDQPRAGGADLAGVQEDRGEREVEGRLAVGVGEHDVGVLAAELEGDLLHGRRRRRHDPLPVGRPPVNETRSTSRVLGERRAGVAGRRRARGWRRPAGRPASSSRRMSRIAVCGVSSLGLSTKRVARGQARARPSRRSAAAGSSTG